jgi:hypothetical protein
MLHQRTTKLLPRAAGPTQQCSEQLPMSNADALSDQGSGMRISQRSSVILSRLPPQMTKQLFACAFKRAAKAGEALFVAGDCGASYQRHGHLPRDPSATER